MADSIGMPVVFLLGQYISEKTSRMMIPKYQGDQAKKKVKRIDGNKKNIFGFASSLLNTLCIAFVIVGYPIMMMPVYRSESTSDGTRLFLACIIHPLVHEVTMSMQRNYATGSHLLHKTVFDSERIHFPLASLGGAHYLEAVFIMCKFDK